MKYLIKCCGRIVDVDNKPIWCIKCGDAQAEAMESIGLYWYECDECGGASGSADDWVKAREKWNKRI